MKKSKSHQLKENEKTLTKLITPPKRFHFFSEEHIKMGEDIIKVQMVTSNGQKRRNKEK